MTSLIFKRDAAFVYLVYVALSSFGMSITFITIINTLML